MAKKWPRRTCPSAPPFCYNINRWNYTIFQRFFFCFMSNRTTCPKAQKQAPGSRNPGKIPGSFRGLRQGTRPPPSARTHQQGQFGDIRQPAKVVDSGEATVDPGELAVSPGEVDVDSGEAVVGSPCVCVGRGPAWAMTSRWRQ